MKVRYIELAEHLRTGGLEKAAADMAEYLNDSGVEVIRGQENVVLDQSLDVVHFHGLWSPTHYKLARQCWNLRLPTVVSPHGMLEPWAWRHRRWKKWPYFHLIEKRRLVRADAILATADAEKQNLREFFPDTHIEVLTLGIEPDVAPDFHKARELLGWGEEERVLVYLSRVHPKKGLKELLESLLEVGETESLGDLRLMILGDGPADYEAICRSLVDRLGELMEVEWIPPQWGDEKWKFLQAADLFCLPTYSENFGIVILEAGMVGTRIFTTTGTPWKHVEEAGFGYVVDPDPANYPAVLRAFIKAPLASIRNQRNAFSQWTSEHYAWPNIVSQYKAFYERLAHAGKGSG